jgi:molybdopterin synthase catalytic subunit
VVNNEGALQLFGITPASISPDALSAAVSTIAARAGDGCGAVTTFVGLVRRVHAGRTVRFLEYEAYDALAVKTFEQIGREAAETWPGTVLGMWHRTGRLEIGEASIVIAAASAHRAASFEVCRYAIERVKQIAPVWKHEYFEGGSDWVEGATADPTDAAARAEARARACASA